MGLLGWFNFLIVQWFFIRLVKVTDDDNNHIKWTIIGPILPLTGWCTDYVRLRPDRYIIKRSIKHWWQRRTRGWDDSVTWNLYTDIAKFVLPRLKRFKELHNGYPAGTSEKTWEKNLDDMIYAMDVAVKESDVWVGDDDVDWYRVSRGLRAFGTKFRNLWW